MRYKKWPEFKGQLEMFEWIWDQAVKRDGDPMSEISGAELKPKGHSQWHWQFLHLFNKESYPEHKLNPNNIMLGLPIEHEEQEKLEPFRRRKEEYRKEYLNGTSED